MKIDEKIDIWIANADIDIMYGIKRTRDESARLKNSMKHEDFWECINALIKEIDTLTVERVRYEDLIAIKEAMKDD